MYIDADELFSLTQIFVTQRLPRPSAQHLAETLQRWEQHYGIKWVVDRLKLVRAALLSSNRDGLRTHNDGSLYGAMRPVDRLSQSSRRGAIRADRILRVYGRWEAEKPTELDFQRFANDVRFADYQYTGTGFPVRSADIRLARSCQSRAQFLREVPNSESKIVPFLRERESEVLPHEHYELLKEFCPNLLLNHLSFFQRHVYQEDMDEYSEYAEASYMPIILPDNPNDVVGKIACLTKDRGLKKRFIANPHRLLQLATSRLQDACARYLRALPESFVFDQDQSVDWVKAQLNEGKLLWSLDLSSATDNFPLAPQVQLLNELFPDLSQDIRLWQDICTSSWLSSSEETEIRYGKGQPMGTAPSFAAFTISHIHFARSCGGNDSNFRVIGDDIVISCPKVAERYMDGMKLLGVEISLMKSLMGDSKAEFAGRIIDEIGLWPVYKASPMRIKSDPLGMVRQYGLAGLSLIPRARREIVSFAARLPYIGPQHCWDMAALDEINDIDLDLVYQDKEIPYPIRRWNPKSSIWVKPVSRFEHAQHDDAAGLLVSRGFNNDPQLAEHVNSNLSEGRDYPLLAWHKSMLQTGSSVPFWDERRDQKYPISYIKGLYKLRVNPDAQAA
jgi:hypothetical protein